MEVVAITVRQIWPPATTTVTGNVSVTSFTNIINY